MRYIELIMENPLVWGLFIVYLVLTSALAWVGHKKTTDISSFALGGGNMNPIVVGITLASSIASTATFVINPGFVYVHGMSAVMHLGVAAGLGVITGLLTMSFGFRRVGKQTSALTLPQWMGERYKSKAMTVLYALINLLTFTFVVLIVSSLSIVMQQTLGLTNVESLLLVIGFVFSYIFVGGTYAHAYTNTLQGIIMVVIAAIIVFSGFDVLFSGEVMSTLAAVEPGELKAVKPGLDAFVNPASPLFGTTFSVFVCGVVIGFALMAQPHIMIKALYVESDREVWQYLGVCIVVSLFFSALLFVGIYAHMRGMPATDFIDPTTGAFRQDMVMAVYITKNFSPTMVAIIMVALMSAGMSTLDGILIALSSIAANDLFLNLTRGNVLADKEPEEQARIAHRAGQVILIGLGVVTFFASIEPPKLLGIFGQLGVYGIVAASLGPLLGGILFPRLTKVPVFIAAGCALVTHFGLYQWGAWAIENEKNLSEIVAGWGPLAWIFDTGAFQLGFFNPGVTATYGILVGVLVVIPAGLMSGGSGEAEPAGEPDAEPEAA